MGQIEEDIKELKRLNNNLDYFERKRKFRNNLKVVIIGFFIWKDLDEKIAQRGSSQHPSDSVKELGLKRGKRF